MDIRFTRFLGIGAHAVVARFHAPGLGSNFALKIFGSLPEDYRYVEPTAQDEHLVQYFPYSLMDGEGSQYKALLTDVFDGNAAQIARPQMGLIFRNPLRAEAQIMQLARRLISDGLKGLATLHGRGLIHRDVRPENIFTQGNRRSILKQQGKFVIGDTDRATDVNETLGRVATGTPGYMAPETVRTGAPQTQAVDYYALAASAFEVIFGMNPLDSYLLDFSEELTTADQRMSFMTRMSANPYLHFRVYTHILSQLNSYYANFVASMNPAWKEDTREVSKFIRMASSRFPARRTMAARRFQPRSPCQQWWRRIWSPK